MSGYAVRKDGQGWRAVDSADECLPEEDFVADQPPIPVPPPSPALDAVAKLKAFLAANPDVAALLK